MNEERITTLLSRFGDTHVLVVGDYFLDRYLIVDRSLSERSLETGLEAYQVTEVKCSPGAAGTVTSNLRALGIQVTALGVIGEDGMGFELLRGLRGNGVNVEQLIQVPDRFTPTYTKPMLQEGDGRIHEIQRIDIKNRRILPKPLEEQLIRALHEVTPFVQGIIVADQVQERNCGVITDRVRGTLGELALAHPNKIVAADSRVRIGEFRHLVLKPNVSEAVHAIRPDIPGQEIGRALVEESGRALYQRGRKPVFLTVGAEGILVFNAEGITHVPGVRVEGPVDIVGAGDSTMAGIVSALCCGATYAEAALIGNLVASITIQQIGTTGTATREQVLERYWAATF